MTELTTRFETIEEVCSYAQERGYLEIIKALVDDAMRAEKINEGFGSHLVKRSSTRIKTEDHDQEALIACLNWAQKIEIFFEDSGEYELLFPNMNIRTVPNEEE